ncbi:MAG: biotin transporter BioY [Chloroflexi bacterium]|jgi:biotin transport system substrate-specific component|nr:biotin transporter BioY [Chloroflexota bacterium]
MTIATPRLVRVPAAERGITIGDFLVPVRMGERMSSRVRHAGLVVLGALLIALTANIAVTIPGTPVPVTGQTFGVLVVGSALGFRRGVMAAALYLLLGVVGLPVYAGQASGADTFGTLAGGIQLAPTGGYLVGFVVAAGLVGRLAELGWDRTPGGAAAAMTLGTITIYAVGVPWLAVSLDVPLGEAARLGLVPFLLGDVLKVALSAATLRASWWLIDRRSADR